MYYYPCNITNISHVLCVVTRAYTVRMKDATSHRRLVDRTSLSPVNITGKTSKRRATAIATVTIQFAENSVCVGGGDGVAHALSPDHPCVCCGWGADAGDET